MCLHWPPRGYFFSCKNGHSRGACVFGLMAAGGRLQSEKEYLRDDVLSWRGSAVCCHGYSARCVVVLCSAQEGRGERCLFFLFVLFFTAPVCGVVCSLVGLSVSENSSPVVVLWAGTSRGLGGVATNDHTPDSRPSSSMCCVKSGESSGLCR